jgi:hypothetical protein
VGGALRVYYEVGMGGRRREVSLRGIAPAAIGVRQRIQVFGPTLMADATSLRANIAETLLVPLIRVQGGKEIQHEKRENIFAGPVRRWH